MKHWFSAVRSAWSHLPHIVRATTVKASEYGLAAFAASLLASAHGGNVTDKWSILSKATVAAYLASLGVLKALIASQFGSPDTAAFDGKLRRGGG